MFEESLVEKVDLLTVQELAERLQLKASWVYSHANELGAYRLGKYLRFSWSRVLQHLNEKPESK